MSEDQEETTLENNRQFRDWNAWIKLRNDIGSPWEKKEAEFHKISSEYAKIAITNLQIINAGGLLAVPTLSNNLLGFSGLNREEKLFLIGWPMGIFICGLVLAILCAFVCYVNFQALAMNAEAQGDYEKRQAEVVNPFLVEAGKIHREVGLAHATKVQNYSRRTVWFTYYAGITTGWLSAISFVSACVFLAIHVRG